MVGDALALASLLCPGSPDDILRALFCALKIVNMDEYAAMSGFYALVTAAKRPQSIRDVDLQEKLPVWTFEFPHRTESFLSEPVHRRFAMHRLLLEEMVELDHGLWQLRNLEELLPLLRGFPEVKDSVCKTALVLENLLTELVKSF